MSGHFWQDWAPRGPIGGHRRCSRGSPGVGPLLRELARSFLGSGVVIDSGVQFGTGVCLGAQVTIGAGGQLCATRWSGPGAAIAPEVALEDCIVAAGVRV